MAGATCSRPGQCAWRDRLRGAVAQATSDRYYTVLNDSGQTASVAEPVVPQLEAAWQELHTAGQFAVPSRLGKVAGGAGFAER
jgi:hypothetical protein